jgi:hypothetical protein
MMSPDLITFVAPDVDVELLDEQRTHLSEILQDKYNNISEDQREAVSGVLEMIEVFFDSQPRD